MGQSMSEQKDLVMCQGKESVKAIAASKVATKNGDAAMHTICNTKLNDIEKHCISQI